MIHSTGSDASKRTRSGIVATCAGIAFALSLGACAHTKDVPRGLLPLQMIAIEGGTFTMGDIFEYEDIDATPVHEVVVEDFQLGGTEVTFEQYDAYARKYGKAFPPDDSSGRGSRAVVNVTWDEATAFCAAYQYRLPTEPEWEFAARARGQRMLYAGTNDEDEAAQYVVFATELVQPPTVVAQKLPNELGLYDMSGNVFEWIADYYPFYPIPEAEPEYVELETAAMRLIRGGSARNPLSVARTYRRASTLATIRSSAVGFRCAAD